MILTKKIEIVVNARVVKHYRDLGYQTGKNQLLNVNVEHLNKGSNIELDIKCDCCGMEYKLSYRNYLKSTKFDNKYYCRKNKCFIEKVKLSTLDKYGVDNTSKLKEKQEKWKNTNLKKYGVENTFQTERVKSIIKEKGGWIPEDELEGFSKYSRIVRRLTLINRKKLIESWNGYDYYDGEYIMNNYNLNYNNPNYPNIDHKISIKYGYLNDISIDEISSLNNLCITKKRINSDKRHMTEKEYKN